MTGKRKERRKKADMLPPASAGYCRSAAARSAASSSDQRSTLERCSACGAARRGGAGHAGEWPGATHGLAACAHRHHYPPAQKIASWVALARYQEPQSAMQVQTRPALQGAPRAAPGTALAQTWAARGRRARRPARRPAAAAPGPAPWASAAPAAWHPARAGAKQCGCYTPVSHHTTVQAKRNRLPSVPGLQQLHSWRAPGSQASPGHRPAAAKQPPAACCLPGATGHARMRARPQVWRPPTCGLTRSAGTRPSASARLASAPAASSACVQRTQPPRAALCSGVAPSRLLCSAGRQSKEQAAR